MSILFIMLNLTLQWHKVGPWGQWLPRSSVEWSYWLQWPNNLCGYYRPLLKTGGPFHQILRQHKCDHSAKPHRHLQPTNEISWTYAINSFVYRIFPKYSLKCFHYRIKKMCCNIFKNVSIPERLLAIGVTLVQCPVWGSYRSTEFKMFRPS